MVRYASLDDLVGAGEQCRRNLEAKRFCGLEVDDELELGWLFDRHIGRLFALEDSVHIAGGASEQIGNINSARGIT